MHTNEGAGATDFAPARITVDVRGLEDFAELLRDELEANFRPTKDQVIAEHRNGVAFGSRHASLDMHLAVNRYHECLTSAVTNLNGYVDASEILIAAAHKVASAYRTADQLSTARLVDVETALNDAVAEAAAAQKAAAAEAQRGAAEQRRARLEREGIL